MQGVTREVYMMDIAELNRRFGIGNQLVFESGPGGLTQAVVTSPKAQATISTYAGQVLSFQPVSAKKDLLFLGEKAYRQAGKAIKGGIPICWPWFGPDPNGKGGPGHGMARASQWQVTQSQQRDNGDIELRLAFAIKPGDYEYWSAPLSLELMVTVGDTLSLAMLTTNNSDSAVQLTQGFHTYFAVGAISTVVVNGLGGVSYIDKMNDSAEETQSGSVSIQDETDRIYHGQIGQLTIDDASLGRRIVIQHKGSASAVVWNPWVETAKAMADLDDDDYQHFICVETVNAGPDVVSVPAGGQASIAVTYGIESR